MRLLLDTHALIWALDAPERLPPTVLNAFDKSSVTVFASAASTWEIAIKVALGRLRFPLAELAGALTDAAFKELPVRRIEKDLGVAPAERHGLVLAERLFGGREAHS